MRSVAVRRCRSTSCVQKPAVTLSGRSVLNRAVTGAANGAMVRRMDTLPKTVAAVDLGSNSFHLVVANVVDGQIRVVDAIKETVRLAGGLRSDGTLEDDARARAIACLERFGDRLRDIDPKHLRAVGTHTFRKARDSGDFRELASAALGHRIEIVAGREEARLVYLGVAHATATEDEGRRLVVDIGGGSTECILGEGYEPVCADSFYMGCVNFSQRYFSDGKVDAFRMHSAVVDAMQELEPAVSRYKALGWAHAFGSSGTIKAIEGVLRAEGFSNEGITAEGLLQLRQRLITAGSVEDADLKGLNTNRVPVLPGGLAVLSAVFDSFALDVMTPSSGAMREGILYDLLGRLGEGDRREETVSRFSVQYQIDTEHAGRVKATALALLTQVSQAWEFDQESAHKFLRWACDLHEIGLAISYKGHHKHGAYILTNADMPGFSKGDQQVLASILRGHRRKLLPQYFGGLEPARALMAERLCVLLRLAARHHRSRTAEAMPEISIAIEPAADESQVSLEFPSGWLENHTLSRADLETEAKFMRVLGYQLVF